MNDYVRKMASIQEVNGVYPIDGADKICQYGINSWRVGLCDRLCRDVQ